ncbi:MAG: repressor LexA [Kiritimatiellia bacterium]|jgi:repressor LexA
MHDLSPRQRQILDFITAQIDQRGICPSYREIGQGLGIGSTNGVSDHIKALERKGYVERVGGRGASRSIRLTSKCRPPESEFVSVPLLGKVAAGEPLLAVENWESTVRVDASMLPSGGKIYALMVSGESMIEDGIYDGDTLFVQQTSTVRDGEIAVVMVEGEATVKRVYREPGRLRLQPANSAMRPIYVSADSGEVHVLGRAVGLYRTL